MSDVAALGPKGTFSEKAARQLYPDADIILMSDVDDVFGFVEDGRGDGVAAIENSLEGSVGKTMEALMEYEVKITAQLTLDISLSLMANEGLKEPSVIISHPHALGQCKRYIREKHPSARTQAAPSTADAIIQAAASEDAAAVGMKDTGLAAGLVSLADDIQDKDSQTRFVSVSKSPASGPNTSIIFAVRDEPGALYSILKEFSNEKINLTKIESRPRRSRLGEYVFYVDYENRGADTGALHERVRERTTYFKDLGSY